MLDGVEADLPSNDELFWAWEIYQHTGDRRDLQLRVRALRRELKPILRGYAGGQGAALQAHPPGSHAPRDRRNLLKAWPALWTFAAVKGVQPTDNHIEPAP